MIYVSQIAINVLLSILRSTFFWVWNISVLFLVLCLHYISFFNFEGNSLVLELFFTTFILSGSVNSFVFYLGTSRELNKKQWDLLIIRPIKSLHLVFGTFCGLMLFQILAGLAFFCAFLLESELVLGRNIGGEVWLSWVLAVLQIAMLTSFYGLVVMWLKGFWASLAMVGAYLLGHLSSYVQTTLPKELSFLTGLLFCVVPDMSVSFPIQADANVPEKLPILFLYSISYLILIIYASTLSLRLTCILR